MINCITSFSIVTAILVASLSGCSQPDHTVSLKNKRQNAIKKMMPPSTDTSDVIEKTHDEDKQQEIADATKELVDEIKARQEEEKAETLEVDQERQEAEDKQLQVLIQEIVHGNNDDVETQSAKQVGEHKIWIDKENRQVIVAGAICLRAGPLEMFVSPMGQKSHETVVTVDAWASEIHICLALCGVMPGTPVEFVPMYKAARGPEVEIEVVWKEGDKIIRRRAQEMIRNSDTQKPMETHWVFGGSQAVEGEGYYGNSGALVCLSNFAIATMDIPIKSLESNDFLLYEALTEKIPEVNTPVFVYFKPKVKDSEIATDKEIAAEVGRITLAAGEDE